MNHRSDSSSREGIPDRHIDADLCLDLLNDLLPPDEKQKLLSHLAVCPSCEKFFRERARVRDRLLAGKTLRSLAGGDLVLEKSLESGPDRVQRESLWDSVTGFWPEVLRRLRRPHFRLAGGVALAAVVVLLVIRLQLRESSDILICALPTTYDDTRLRAIAGAAGKDLAGGLEAYAQEDLDRATSLLKKAEAGELENVRRVYLGSALALEGRYPDAVEVLQTVPFEVVPEEWRHEAQWTLYVSLKRTGREASADSLLRILAERPGEVGGRARRLLD
jgi:hypothetical protein